MPQTRIKWIHRSEWACDDAKGDMLMIAVTYQRPSSETEDWGSHRFFGNGVEELRHASIQRSGAPGAFFDRFEIVGEDSKATITIHRPFGYPVIILDDITTGRFVSSAEVHLEPGVYALFLVT